jgi:hypothetical protein
VRAGRSTRRAGRSTIDAIDGRRSTIDRSTRSRDRRTIDRAIADPPIADPPIARCADPAIRVAETGRDGRTGDGWTATPRRRRDGRGCGTRRREGMI